MRLVERWTLIARLRCSVGSAGLCLRGSLRVFAGRLMWLCVRLRRWLVAWLRLVLACGCACLMVAGLTCRRIRG